MTLYSLSLTFDDDQLSVSGSELDPDTFDQFILLKGIPIPKGFLKSFTFRIRQKGPETDVLANNFGWIMASPRLLAVLRSCGCNIQAIEFGAENVVGATSFSVYHVVNVLNQGKALDTARSDCRMELNDVGEPYIASVSKLVVKRNAARRMLPMFRLAESNGHIIASEQVVLGLERERIRGIGYEEVCANA
jgi:hypothetical protein